MKVDDRDDLLGEALNRAVRNVDPRDQLTVVLGRGRRKSAVRWTAIGVTLSVVFAFVAWTALVLRHGQAQWRTYVGSGGGWSLSYPADWHATTVGQDCYVRGSSGGIVLSNVGFHFRQPSGGNGQCDGRYVMAGFPKDGVGLWLDPAGVAPGGIVDTAFPLELRDFIRTGGVRGGPSARYTPVNIDGSTHYYVRVWIGHRASSEDIDELRRSVSSIRFPGAPRWQTFRDDGLSIGFPSNWHVERTGRSFAVSTHPFGSERIPCGHVGLGMAPTFSESDAVVRVVEQDRRLASPPAQFPPRPEHFGPVFVHADIVNNCDQRVATVQPFVPFFERVTPFEDHGRSFVAYVLVGRNAGADTRNIVWRILDSFRIGPR